jgi:hypothetical protein
VGTRTSSAHVYQLTRCCSRSSVWRDALDIGDLPKLGDNPGPAEKKRKIDRDFPIGGGIIVLALRIVFKLLDSEFEPQDYNPGSFGDWPTTHPMDVYRDVITTSDMYDLPEIVPRFLQMLWQLATHNKESALFVFAAAYDKEDGDLARFAITNFRDLCHPLLLK